jgi:hypothetical protein
VTTTDLKSFETEIVVGVVAVVDDGGVEFVFVFHNEFVNVVGDQRGLLLGARLNISV